MKHFKRSNVRENTRKAISNYYCGCCDEDKSEEMQINEAWEAIEHEEADRIKKEIDISWKEHEADASKDDLEREDNSIAEIEEYFQTLDEIDESKEVEPLYQKNRIRGFRRRKRSHANKRLIKNSKNASKGEKRRKEDDLKNYVKITKKDENGGDDLENLLVNSGKEFKSRFVKMYALVKKAEKLQR